MKPRLVDWLFSVPFLAAFGGLLLLFDPLLRLAWLLGPRPQEIVAGWLQVSLLQAFRIAGTRVDVERSTTLAPGAPYIFISNHQSLFDIPIFGGFLFRHFPKFISKKELAKGLPSISYYLRSGGNAVIDRGDREQAVRAIRELGERVVARGVSAVIYPEGTRAREGALGRFRPEGTRTLLQAAPGIPVVPIAIDESWRLLRFNLMPVPFGTRIRVRIGDPIERHEGEDPIAMLFEVREWIEKTLAEWRGA